MNETISIIFMSNLASFFDDGTFDKGLIRDIKTKAFYG